MPLIKEVILPGGWRDSNGGAMPNYTLLGKPGHRAIQDNDPYFTWQFGVTYKRDENSTEARPDLTFDKIYRFFLATKGYGFLVDDTFDNTSTMRGGEGIIKQEDGAWRTFKRYALDDLIYDHPITRHKAGTTVSAGTLDPTTGIVTGIAEEGTWTGGFLRPMICPAGGIKFNRSPSGVVESIEIQLEEQIEL